LKDDVLACVETLEISYYIVIIIIPLVFVCFCSFFLVCSWFFLGPVLGSSGLFMKNHWFLFFFLKKRKENNSGSSFNLHSSLIFTK
jgi:hypothetical protein